MVLDLEQFRFGWFLGMFYELTGLPQLPLLLLLRET
jgi:hypothetical protein